MTRIEMTGLDAQAEYIEYLVQRKVLSKRKVSKSTNEEKIAQLVTMQEEIYRIFAFRKEKFGSPIPDKWQKWHKERHRPLATDNA